MPSESNIKTIADRLDRAIANEVGNSHEDNLDAIDNKFDNTLSNALKKFNSSTFDDDGFIHRMYGLDIGGKDKDVVKNVLNSVKSDYVNIESLNQSEVLLRRDISNICFQMPEMRDVIYVTRDNIIEANTATGEVSRTLKFKNIKNTDIFETQIMELEDRYDLLIAIKDFIVPDLLMCGEKYVHIIPYSKMFAELELLSTGKTGHGRSVDYSSVFRESIPNYVTESFKESVSLYSEDNVTSLMESVGISTKTSISEDIQSSDVKYDSTHNKNQKMSKEGVTELLRNIDVYNGSSTMMAEMGPDAFSELLHMEYMEDMSKRVKSDPDGADKFRMYMEKYMNEETDGSSVFNQLDSDDINTKSYKDIKGCYIQYLDSLKMVPIRLGRRVVGYYYVTTTMDLVNNPGHPNGIVDLSFQHYTRDRNMVDRLASMIIKSFDRKMLNQNIQLKNEIADVIMAHKFSEGKLSFVYIPESEIVRFTIDEDSNGKGHSMLEPTIFAARSYLMINMYNLLYTLNNTTTRVHYLKSSGLNKNYAAQIQRTIRKFQSRRITIDDIYSYSGVLNKVGGMGEMILPSGRGEYKALETDTIEAAQNPINIEYAEQLRRQALSGTGAPHLLIINALDEIDFAKTAELSNARYESRCGALKINVNRGATKMYRKIAKYNTDMDDDVIKSFQFVLNNSKQQEMNITSDMIDNYNRIVEVAMAIYGNKNTWEDDKGNPTNNQIRLRRLLARKYLPQLNHDDLDEIVDEVFLLAQKDTLQDVVNKLSIEDNDLDDIKGKK